MNTPKIRIVKKKFPRRQNSNWNLLIHAKNTRNRSNWFRAGWCCSLLLGSITSQHPPVLCREKCSCCNLFVFCHLVCIQHAATVVVIQHASHFASQPALVQILSLLFQSLASRFLFAVSVEMVLSSPSPASRLIISTCLASPSCVVPLHGCHLTIRFSNLDSLAKSSSSPNLTVFVSNCFASFCTATRVPTVRLMLRNHLRVPTLSCLFAGARTRTRRRSALLESQSPSLFSSLPTANHGLAPLTHKSTS